MDNVVNSMELCCLVNFAVMCEVCHSRWCTIHWFKNFEVSSNCNERQDHYQFDPLQPDVRFCKGKELRVAWGTPVVLYTATLT